MKNTDLHFIIIFKKNMIMLIIKYKTVLPLVQHKLHKYKGKLILCRFSLPLIRPNPTENSKVQVHFIFFIC